MEDIRRTRRLDAADDTAKATVMIATTPDGVPMFSGAGNLTWLCCGCDKLLVKCLAPAQVRRLIFRCGQCGTTSEIPGREFG